MHYPDGTESGGFTDKVDFTGMLNYLKHCTVVDKGYAYVFGNQLE